MHDACIHHRNSYSRLRPCLRKLARVGRLRGTIRNNCRLVRCNAALPTNLPKAETAVKVVFCVTSLNRTWQLKLAFPMNIVATWRYRDYVSWTVVDLNPQTDNEIGTFFGEVFRHAVMSFPDDPKSEHVRLYKADPTFTHQWHASIAKNTSHMFAVTTSNCHGPFCHYCL